MSDSWLRLISLWRDAGLVIRPGVDASAIHAFETKHGIVMPNDLRNYWLAVDGMEVDLDPGLNRFWPLDLVKPVSEELTEIHPDRWAYPDCFVIADHCLWCLGWAVRLGRTSTERSGPMYLVSGGDPPGWQVAPSFTAFVEMYLVDQESVLRSRV